METKKTRFGGGGVGVRGRAHSVIFDWTKKECNSERKIYTKK